MLPATKWLTVVLTILSLQKVTECRSVYYDFHVYYVQGAPDGVAKETILTVNGQFPGPTIEATAGDTVQVVVHNEIQDGQNVTLHWHGIAQMGTPFEDGASLITQCPLKVGHSTTYTFVVPNPGTFWYHSHVNSQYTEGLWGPLIVRSPNERFSYDGEILVTFNDWYHRTAHENEYWHVSTLSEGVPPYPDSALMNGMGRYSCVYARTRSFLNACDPELQRRPVFEVDQNKTYRVRVINTAANSVFRFSIDGHRLETIEVDGADVFEKVIVDEAIVSQGQRYSFLIQTHSSNGDYLVRANLMSEILMLIVRENIAPYPEALLPNATAILRVRPIEEELIENYHNVGDSVAVTSEIFDYTQPIPQRPNWKPVTLDPSLLLPVDGVAAPDYYDKQFTVSATFTYDVKNIRRGGFNGSFFNLPDFPLLMSVCKGDTIPDEIHGAMPHYIELGDVVELVINNPFKGPHPFHLHGHHFWVLGTGEHMAGDYDATKHPLKLLGAKRDTIYVQEESWGVLRFVADNPGVWNFHCHNDWHNLSGMSATFIEAADILHRNYTPPAEAKRVCLQHGIDVPTNSGSFKF